MRCYTCHRSNWMQGKVLGFLQNLLNNYKGQINDSDVFRPLEVPGVETYISEKMHHWLPVRLHNCIPDMKSTSVHKALCQLWNMEEARSIVKALIPDLAENAAKTPWNKSGEENPFHAKMDELQRTMKLNDMERDIMLVSLAARECILWDPQGCDERDDRIEHNLFLMSKCLNVSETDILENVSLQKPLRRFRCLDDDLDINGRLFPFLCGMTNEPLTSSYYLKEDGETLPWSDFADMSKTHGTLLKRMLNSNDKPVNILFYGAPGTGKTSFAHTLAKEIGRTCYNIAQNVNDRGCHTNSSPDFRFAALQICDSQIVPEESLIVVDEADDMLRGSCEWLLPFGGAPSAAGDKGLLNTVLDTMKTSVIWITNTPAEALDESSRRRFNYSICFKPLDSEQRKRIWKNNIARLKMGRLIGAEQLEEFSMLYPVSAGGISLTLENLKRLNPSRAEVPQLMEQLMKPHCELLGINLTDDKLLPSRDYSLEGLNIQGDVKLERIVEAVRAFQNRRGRLDPDRPRMNLLLSGAPGTGKTEFVKYLGNTLKTKIKVCMGSDLLGKYVGETEKNIVNAFRQAEAEHAILFLDEIDGLVHNRANATRPWEVTQVDQLLHQMENFDGVMVGATNYIQNLDQAIMRRFTFKLHFDFLDENGRRLFFERMFQTTLTDEEACRLNAITNLTPGDFRTVRQSLFYFGDEPTNAQRLEGLEREAAAKNGGAFVPRGRIGF